MKREVDGIEGWKTQEDRDVWSHGRPLIMRSRGQEDKVPRRTLENPAASSSPLGA